MREMPDEIDVCDTISCSSAWQPKGSTWWKGDAYEFHHKTRYHHSRIVEALQEENKRLRENLKEFAEVIVIHGGYPTDKQILMINSILEE